MKIRQPNHVQPTYANFAVIDTKGQEVILNLCFAEGDAKTPSASVVHKVVMSVDNFARLLDAGQSTLLKLKPAVSDA